MHKHGGIRNLTSSFAAATVLANRYQAELEAQVLESEIAIQVTAQVEARVQEVMASQAVQQSLQERLIRERKLLEEQVGLAWLYLVVRCLASSITLCRCHEGINRHLHLMLLTKSLSLAADVNSRGTNPSAGGGTFQ